MNILLACAGAVTTTVMAEKMEKAAQAQGKDYKVWAVEVDNVDAELAKTPVDIVLLGPQVKYKLKAIQKRCATFNVPVVCIEPRDFGMGNAENILKSVEKTLEGAK